MTSLMTQLNHLVVEYPYLWWCDVTINDLFFMIIITFLWSILICGGVMSPATISSGVKKCPSRASSLQETSFVYQNNAILFFHFWLIRECCIEIHSICVLLLKLNYYLFNIFLTLDICVEMTLFDVILYCVKNSYKLTKLMKPLIQQEEFHQLSFNRKIQRT